MAAARCAVRRLGGSLLQRKQAAVTSPAVAEQRRRLAPRLMSTEEPSRAGIMREIQQKKEELYDVISKADREVVTNDWRNIWLLQHLAVQVNPRPHDSQWRRSRSSRRSNDMLETAGVISLTWMLATWAAGYSDYFLDKKKKKKQVRTVNEEENQ